MIGRDVVNIPARQKRCSAAHSLMRLDPDRRHESMPRRVRAAGRAVFPQYCRNARRQFRQCQLSASQPIWICESCAAGK